MYKRILVAVDESGTSQRALKEAVALADDQAAELRAVHVVDVQIYGYVVELINVDEVQQAWREAGEKLLADAARTASEAGVKVSTVLLDSFGDRVSAVVLKEAKEWGADLVVMGTHGRRGLGHLLLGSVAEGVVRFAGVPVLLIHAHEQA